MKWIEGDSKDINNAAKNYISNKRYAFELNLQILKKTSQFPEIY